jgi:membrane peptidoglycan carboxypeptidase
MAAEDRRFLKHGGVDLRAICRALVDFLRTGVLTGASTIEQQLVRTITGRKERTLSRKLEEIVFATLVNHYVPKADIPGLYLSLAYFGSHMNGLVEACQKTQTDVSRITIQHAAAIVARLKYPEPISAPRNRIDKINSRARYILRVVRDSKILVSDLRGVENRGDTLLGY